MNNDEDIFERYIRVFKQEIRGNGDIKPTLVMFKGNTISLVEPPSRSAFDTIISFFKPDKYMFFSTAWQKVLKTQEKSKLDALLKEYKIGDIAKSDDKQEILICLYVSPERKVMKSIPIKRKGQKVIFGKPWVSEGKDVKGRLVKEVSNGVDYVV